MRGPQGRRTEERERGPVGRALRRHGEQGGRVRRDRHPPSSALMGASAIQGVFCLMVWGFWGPPVLVNWRVALVYWLMVLSFAPLLGLGILARWKPLLASLFGAAVYMAFLVFMACVGTDLLHPWSLIFEIPIIALLAIGLASAARRKAVDASGLQPGRRADQPAPPGDAQGSGERPR